MSSARRRWERGGEIAEWADLGNELEQEGEDARTDPRTAIAVAETLLVVGFVDPVVSFLGTKVGSACSICLP